MRRALRWTGRLVGVLVLAVVIVLAGFRAAAARRQTRSPHDAALLDFLRATETREVNP
jgi:hypothetical protein